MVATLSLRGAIRYARHSIPATGFSTYYLLYGQQPVFSFNLEEITWQTLNWDQVHTHEELIAIRAAQITERNEKMEQANAKLKESRRLAIENLAKRHHFQFNFFDYEEGMYVWLGESRLDEIKGGKGEWTYSGPYVVGIQAGHDGPAPIFTNPHPSSPTRYHRLQQTPQFYRLGTTQSEHPTPLLLTVLSV
ncbi:hypothetical protein CPB85DRAFT_1437489 [Mucidula mucida]|nr:hypothetical protein CPB85DRAFT_1437489 [Mucidula mucida]